MTYPAYLRERARELRTAKLGFDEIAECLALPKSTVCGWIGDLPLGRDRRWSEGQRKGTEAMQDKWRVFRAEAYDRGLSEWEELLKLPTFRDFVVLCIAEGYKRSRDQVRSRVWRCAHGVAAVTVHDTYFRGRLQAWIDRIHETWG